MRSSLLKIFIVITSCKIEVLGWSMVQVVKYQRCTLTRYQTWKRQHLRTWRQTVKCCHSMPSKVEVHHCKTE